MKIACIAAANGERAPARMFVAVRASAPVAAMPPKNGHRMLPMPSAISSEFGSWRVPLMPSATTAAISDSIAPSIAIANADGSSSRIDLQVERERRMPGSAICHGTTGSGGSGGMP